MSRFLLHTRLWERLTRSAMAHLQLLYRNGPASRSIASLSLRGNTSSVNRPLTQSELDSVARQTAELDAKLDVLFAARTPRSNFATRRREAHGTV
ncbi:hypothetical protein ACVWYO_001516 [Sphingomonas sp. UYP23]